jgi:hypothetical protein
VDIQHEKIKEGISNARSHGKQVGRKPTAFDRIKMIKALKQLG